MYKWEKYLSEKYLGKEFKCSCGRVHSFPVQFIYLGYEAKKVMVRWLRNFSMGRKILMVGDENTWEIAGEELAIFLSACGYQVREKIFTSPGKRLTPRLEYSLSLLEDLSEVDFTLSVGSGTITDLVRYASYKMGTPFLSYPTAPSMNGYTSSIAALIVKGIKSTLEAKPPLAIMADLEILSSAPLPMIKAGFCDLLSKTVAHGDWKLAHIVRGSYFCKFPLKMLKEMELLLEEISEGIKERRKKDIEILCKLLFLSGLSMTAAGTSSPTSGAEHLVSHFWDMTLPSTRHNLHGLQVAIGTRVSAYLYQRLWERGKEEGSSKEARLEELYPIFGEFTPRVWKEYIQKKKDTEREKTFILKNWEKIKSCTKPLISSPHFVDTLLQKSASPMRVKDLGLGKEELKKAILYGRFIRARYTLFDFAHTLGQLEKFVEEEIEKFL